MCKAAIIEGTFRQAKTDVALVRECPLLKMVPTIRVMVSGGQKDPVE